MFDRDLAELYKLETRVLNPDDIRNLVRFQEEFRFQLSPGEPEFGEANSIFFLHK